MNVHKIAVIAGDGIGPEVIDEGIKVLKKVAKKQATQLPLSALAYKLFVLTALLLKTEKLGSDTVI